MISLSESCVLTLWITYLLTVSVRLACTVLWLDCSVLSLWHILLTTLVSVLLGVAFRVVFRFHQLGCASPSLCIFEQLHTIDSQFTRGWEATCFLWLAGCLLVLSVSANPVLVLDPAILMVLVLDLLFGQDKSQNRQDCRCHSLFAWLVCFSTS